MTEFIFVRHGKSQANKDRRIAMPDSPLTKEGEAQARKTGRELKSRNITAIVASPLKRAKQTARIIAKELGISDIAEIPELAERDFGTLKGKAKKHASAFYYTIDGEYGVEPLADTTARMQAALKKIQAIQTPGELLVVGHATSGFYLQQIASGKRSPKEFDAPFQLGNGTSERIVIKPQRRFNSRIAFLVLSLAVLAIIVGGTLAIQAPAEIRVKQQTIPLSADDFKDDPRLQKVIQEQLQQQPSTPQQQNSPRQADSAANSLQPVPQGIPNN